MLSRFKRRVTSCHTVSATAIIASFRIFGYILGNISTLISAFDPQAAEKAHRMESLKCYMEYQKIPPAVQKRVRTYCAHYFLNKPVIKETWDFLPENLRREVLRVEDTQFRDAFPRFRRSTQEGAEALTHRIADLALPYFAAANGSAYVDPNIHLCSEITFVQKGELHVYPTDNLKTSRALAIKWSGSWFGHTELLESVDNPIAEVQWQHGYVAKMPSELMLLQRNDVKELLLDFEFFRDILLSEPQINPHSLGKRRPSAVFAETPTRDHEEHDALHDGSYSSYDA